jgi:predicted nucleic acid-binding protein
MPRCGEPRFDRRYVLLFSPPLAAEFCDILRREFHLPHDKVQRELRAIARIAEIVRPSVTLNVAADPDDYRVLECAISGKADLIVSNNKHLRSLGSFRGIAIVTGADFRRILGI